MYVVCVVTERNHTASNASLLPSAPVLPDARWVGLPPPGPDGEAVENARRNGPLFLTVVVVLQCLFPLELRYTQVLG